MLETVKTITQYFYTQETRRHQSTGEARLLCPGAVNHSLEQTLIGRGREWGIGRKEGREGEGMKRQEVGSGE